MGKLGASNFGGFEENLIKIFIILQNILKFVKISCDFLKKRLLWRWEGIKRGEILWKKTKKFNLK